MNVNLINAIPRMDLVSLARNRFDDPGFEAAPNKVSAEVNDARSQNNVTSNKSCLRSTTRSSNASQYVGANG